MSDQYALNADKNLPTENIIFYHSETDEVPLPKGEFRPACFKILPSSPFSGGRDTISLRRASLHRQTIRTMMIVKQHLQLARMTFGLHF